MYCTNCGIDLGPTANFCSSCGSSLSGVPAPPRESRDWNFHVNVLAWLVIAHAALVGIIGIAVMFGGLLARKLVAENPSLLDHADPKSIPPPEVFVTIIGPITLLIGLIFMLIALPSIAAGIGLLRYRTWGRVLMLVLSFLRLLEFPFGTATAIYSFWVLLSDEGKRFYARKSAQAEA